MKIKHLSIFMMLMLAFSTISVFNSCSKDDDDEDDFSIVGSWKLKYPNEEGYDIITFNSDGIGTFVEYDEKGKAHDSEHFRYSVSKDGKTLKIIWSDGDVEVVSIEWVGQNKIKVYDPDDPGEYDIMIRQ